MKDKYTWNHGAVNRGPRDQRCLALVFTGGDFGEGFDVVLSTLEHHGVPGSFYFTGGFLRNAANQEPVRKAVAAGHTVGPHSDGHLLYAPWEDRQKTLVTRQAFLDDLERNVAELRKFGVPAEHLRWWIPPYEWYNEEVAAWAREAGHPLFCFTPGTLSHADYTEDNAPNYRSNEKIFESIVDCERENSDGLNGFLLLTHVGAGDGRTEKFFDRLDELIAFLKEAGYRFASVPDLLEGAGG